MNQQIFRTKLTKAPRLIRETKPLTIINEEDARIEVLTNLLESAGNAYRLTQLCTDRGFTPLLVADHKEISSRLNVSQHLLNELDLLDGLRKETNDYEKVSTLPAEFTDFQKYNKALQTQETSFWKRTKILEEILQRNYLSERLTHIQEWLEREISELYKAELAVAENMKSVMQSAVLSQGFVTVTAQVDRHTRKFTSTDCFVSDQISYKIAGEDPRKTAKIYRTPRYLAWLKKFKSFELKLDKREERKREKQLDKLLRKFNQLMELGEVDCIASDVRTYLDGELVKRRDMLDLLPEEIEQIDFKFFYTLDIHGLNIQLVDISPQSSEATDLNFNDHIPAFNPDLVSKHRTGNGINSAIQTKRALHGYSSGAKFVQAMFHSSLSERTRIQATTTSQKYQCDYFSLAKLVNQDDIDTILEWQYLIDELIDEMNVWGEFITSLAGTEKPTCIARVSESDKASFQTINLIPIQLLGEIEDVQPFNLVTLNGEAMNLTGQNASGKSTCMMAIIYSILLTHAGLPILAEEASISTVHSLLLSFLDRSDTKSTYDLKFTKDMNILEHIESTPINARRQSIAIIDELGSATTENDGAFVAKHLLLALDAQNITLITSTQIPELSSFIDENINGENFIVSGQRVIERGIGKGDAHLLAESRGFFDLTSKLTNQMPNELT